MKVILISLFLSPLSWSYTPSPQELTLVQQFEESKDVVFLKKSYIQLEKNYHARILALETEVKKLNQRLVSAALIHSENNDQDLKRGPANSKKP